MGNIISKVFTWFSPVSTTTEATTTISALSNDTIPIHCRDSQAENLENITLIWLDQSFDENDDDCKKTVRLLCKINNYLLIYTDTNLCIDKISSVDNEIVVLIVSGILSRDILPHIHSLQQLDSVFIFCSNRSAYEDLKEHYSSKVIDIFTEQESLMKAIRDHLNLVSKQLMAFSFFNQKQKSSRDLTKEAASFLWFQLLFSVLKQFPRTEDATNQMVTKCEQYYRGNETELEDIERFRKDYRPQDAIAWYTEDSFVYHLLNKALRTEDIDGLYLFRFYIIDLCKQLEEESQKNVGIITVYRGQVMSEQELDRLKSSVGSLISTNGFFSTTLVKSVAMDFIERSKRDGLKPVLFEITADSSINLVVFANVEQFARIIGEQEVLFSIGAVFSITNIEFDDELNGWVVKMTATDEGMKEAQEYIDATKKGSEDTNISIEFGDLLIKMNELTKAERYFNLLLETAVKDSSEEADILNAIGSISYYRGQHSVALNYFNCAYKIRKNHFDSNHSKIADSMNSIAAVYFWAHDFEKAIDYHTQVLNINRANYGEHHIKIANSLQNLGQVYRNKREFDIALTYMSQALTIQRSLFPEKHSKIAAYLWDIGIVYAFQEDHDSALQYYFEALNIFEKTLPPGHRDTSRLFVAIVEAHKGKQDYEAALTFCQTKLNEIQEVLGDAHVAVGQILFQIGDILRESNEIDKSMFVYQKALIIFEQKCHPPEEELVSHCLNRAAIIQEAKENFHFAVFYYKKQLDIEQKLYLPDDPKIEITQHNINRMFFKMLNSESGSKYLADALKSV